MYGERKTWKLVIGIMIILPVLILGSVRLIKDIMFDRDCMGHIKRAGDANTVELAMEEMQTVVKYLESHEMTDGHTSLLYNTTDEDVGFWYKNLKSSLNELEKVRPETTQLERSNILLKLRETLLDGKSVTVPDGISAFPNNTTYVFGFGAFGILALFGIVLIWQYTAE